MNGSTCVKTHIADYSCVPFVAASKAHPALGQVSFITRAESLYDSFVPFEVTVSVGEFAMQVLELERQSLKWQCNCRNGK